MAKRASWYEALPSFSDFNAVTEDQWYHEVPDDWTVFMTDIRDSTQAIEEGRYRDVNTIGAASISTVVTALGHDFPYVFGGDGATILSSPEDHEKVAATLGKLAVMSYENFDLYLRVGAMTVKDLHDLGQHIRLAKYELVPGRAVAMFRGGGVHHAVELMKEDEKKYLVPQQDPGLMEFTGLSCRWNQIPNQHGVILTLLVESRSEVPVDAYQEVLAFLMELFDGNLRGVNPINMPKMGLRGMADSMAAERRFHRKQSGWSYFARMAEIVLEGLGYFLCAHPAKLCRQRVGKSLQMHSDYQKFDDMMRMVIDCSREQLEEILAFLEKKYQEGELYYGTHESETSLMTCFIEGLSQGKHIHFIDGDDGGYAMAAKSMKNQMKAA